MAAIVFPSNPAAQSPTNTFSPTSVPANTYNSYTYTWNGTAWTSSAAGGGGGTVTGVAGTAPIVSSGGSAPTISITPATSGAAGSMSAADKAKLDGAATIVSSVTGTAPIAVATGTSTPVVSIGLGLGTAVNGTNIAVSIPVAGVPPAANTTATGATNGSLYWDDNLTQLFIRYSNGGTPVWVAAAPAASGGATLNPATAAEAAAGTLTTVYSSPATSVPKDASGMTGAAILPSGTDLQRAAITTPIVGMQRYNTDSGCEEIYTGASIGWRPVAWQQSTSSYPDLSIASGATVSWSSINGIYNNVTIAGTVNLTGSNKITAFGNVTIAATAVFNGVGTGIPGGAGGGTQGPYITGSNGRGLAGGVPGKIPATAGFFNYPESVSPISSGGGGGDATGAGSVSGSGGGGGACLSIVSERSISFAGTCNFKGGNAGSGSGVAAGGSGGGSGGLLSLTSTVSVIFSGSADVSGGNGGNGVGLAPGGGGGGGGWVRFLAPLVTNTGTVTKAAGTTGSPSVGNAANVVYCGTGGSYAGTGGQVGQPAFSIPDFSPTPGILDTNGVYS